MAVEWSAVYIGVCIAIFDSTRLGVGFQPQSLTPKTRRMVSQPEDKTLMKVRLTNLLSNPFGLPYRKRDTVCHVGGVFVL